MFSGVNSHDRTTIVQNVQIVAEAARLFKVPTILSTVAADSFSGASSGCAVILRDARPFRN
jgi:nicotinamidase-related amidase